jgi:hypothetical protein
MRSHLYVITQSHPVDVWPVERDDNLDRRRRQHALLLLVGEGAIALHTHNSRQPSNPTPTPTFNHIPRPPLLPFNQRKPQQCPSP